MSLFNSLPIVRVRQHELPQLRQLASLHTYPAGAPCHDSESRCSSLPRARSACSDLVITTADTATGTFTRPLINSATCTYNGTTTLCEGLWMGVPPVSLCGRVPASRVGASLLHSLGLANWVAQTPQEFVAIAKNSSQDLAGLATLRAGLRQRFSQSTLGSPGRFALEFEAGLLKAYAGVYA